MKTTLTCTKTKEYNPKQWINESISSSLIIKAIFALQTTVHEQNQQGKDVNSSVRNDEKLLSC